MTTRRAAPWNWMLVAASVVAWTMMLSSDLSLALPAICAPTTLGWASVPDRMEGVIRLTSSARLLMAWATMLGAMMLPLLLRPLATIADDRAAAGFVFAYLAIWTPAVAIIALASTALALAMQAAPFAGALVVVGIATAWHGSPIRARCLCRCHRPATTGGLAEGAAFGLSCIGVCWALMLLPHLAGPVHLPVMAATTVLLLRERRHAADPTCDERLLVLGTLLVVGGLIATSATPAIAAS